MGLMMWNKSKNRRVSDVQPRIATVSELVTAAYREIAEVHEETDLAAIRTDYIDLVVKSATIRHPMRVHEELRARYKTTLNALASLTAATSLRKIDLAESRGLVPGRELARIIGTTVTRGESSARISALIESYAAHTEGQPLSLYSTVGEHIEEGIEDGVRVLPDQIIATNGGRISTAAVELVDAAHFNLLQLEEMAASNGIRDLYRSGGSTLPNH